MMKYMWWIVAAWTVVLGGLLVRDLLILKETTKGLAIREARATFQKDEAFRYWSATHGGFYVPVDEHTPPSPYLSHIKERDIETPSGVKLTLMNPAYALRQMNEDFAETYGIGGHITSLKPLRQENAPDNWEHTALESFERGEQEVLEFTMVEGKPFLRLMQPLITQKGCLKCHGHQGYKVGDVRGGVSVTVPLETFAAEEKHATTTHVLSFSLIWLFGFGLIFKGSQIINKGNNERDETYKMMKASYKQLEKDMNERSSELVQTNEKLQGEIAKRKLTEESNEHLGHILEDSLNEIYSFDAKTLLFLHVNRSGCDNLGYSLEELKEMTPTDIKPEFCAEEFIEFIQPLYNGAVDKLVFETIHQRKNGSTYSVEVHLQLYDSKFLAIISDISKRKKVEKNWMIQRKGIRV